MVTRAGRFAPSTPFVTLSNGYPISFIIQFKILTLTYNTLSSGKPSYLANLIHLATPNRNLRFNKGPLLSAAKCKTKTGTRVFSVCVCVCLCFTFSLEQTFLVYPLFWIADLFSSMSENAPFWPSVSSLVSWFPDLLITNKAFLRTQVFCLMDFGFKRLWTWLRRGYRRYRIFQYCIVMYCIVSTKKFTKILKTLSTLLDVVLLPGQ